MSLSLSALKKLYSADKRRTQYLQEFAEELVKLRHKHLDDDGNPDWGGRTPAYRLAVQKMYEEAGIPSTAAMALQASVRTHIETVLKKELTDIQWRSYMGSPA